MAHDFSRFCTAFLRDLANSTAVAFGSRASIDCARKLYSREIDMHARLKTRRTAWAGVGIVGFISVLRLLVAVSAASRAVSAADSPGKGGAVLRAQHQA